MPLISSVSARYALNMNVTRNNLHKLDVKNVTSLSSEQKENHEKLVSMMKRYVSSHAENKNKQSKIEVIKQLAQKPVNKKFFMRELVAWSNVVENSHKEAVQSFKIDPRHNNVISKQCFSYESDTQSLKQGNVSSLIGKGVIASKDSSNILPFPIGYVRNGAEEESVSLSSTKECKTGLQSYQGNQVVSAELIPGSPLGQYFGQSSLGKDFSLMKVGRGSKGTIGISLDISRLKEGQPLLIHGGVLSGCTISYAVKNSQLFVFHAGKDGNDSSSWKTRTHGADSIAKSAVLLSPTSNTPGTCMNNQALSDYLSSNFDRSALVYCGHGESVVGHDNTNVFDYNKNTDSSGGRIGNAVALAIKQDGKISIQVLGDDMTINKSTFEATSLRHSIFDLIPNSFEHTRL